MSKIISTHYLQIDLQGANEPGLFKWLIASFLMGKRIQGPIAPKAYQVIVEKHHRNTPHKLASCSRARNGDLRECASMHRSLVSVECKKPRRGMPCVSESKFQRTGRMESVFLPPVAPQWELSPNGHSFTIWTALPPRFEEIEGLIPTVDDAVSYLAGLSADAQEHARDYVRQVPAQIDTSYRREISSRLGWHQ